MRVMLQLVESRSRAACKRPENTSRTVGGRQASQADFPHANGEALPQAVLARLGSTMGEPEALQADSQGSSLLTTAPDWIAVAASKEAASFQLHLQSAMLQPSSLPSARNQQSVLEPSRVSFQSVSFSPCYQSGTKIYLQYLFRSRVEKGWSEAHGND